MRLTYPNTIHQLNSHFHWKTTRDFEKHKNLIKRRVIEISKSVYVTIYTLQYLLDDSFRTTSELLAEVWTATKFNSMNNHNRYSTTKQNWLNLIESFVNYLMKFCWKSIGNTLIYFFFFVSKLDVSNMWKINRNYLKTVCLYANISNTVLQWKMSRKGYF